MAMMVGCFFFFLTCFDLLVGGYASSVLLLATYFWLTILFAYMSVFVCASSIYSISYFLGLLVSSTVTVSRTSIAIALLLSYTINHPSTLTMNI